MDLVHDAAAAALSWANEVAMLGSDREQGLESHDGILMVGNDQAHVAMQGFSSLMMMSAETSSFPMVILGHQEQIRTPSTVLSLQSGATAAAAAATTADAAATTAAAAAAAATAAAAASTADAKTGTSPSKKRGRQKGPGKPKSHYLKERDSSFQLVMKLPLKSRKLFCVAEFYKYMSQSSSDSLCKVTEAYAKAGESVGVSGKTSRKWVEDWEKRADGTFSESQQGKHVKVEWLLQPEHLQSKARVWIDQNCPKKGDPPRKDSIIKMFRDFCNNDLLQNLQTQAGESLVDNQRKISSETARSWLHRLGFNNFKDFKKSSSKT